MIRFFLENKLVTFVLLVVLCGWGVLAAPFDWRPAQHLLDPVAVDAIPDIGENQQIVYTPWEGRSPRDVEDQLSFPLSTALLGIPGVKTIRSSSAFGFSSIYVIFKDDVDFYWSRSRIIEKLNSLPPNLLPEDVSPRLGPDATALGQVFWYTLEGRDPDGNPTGGWSLDELRSIQDFTVRYGLAAADGVAEVASIGGFVREYQVDVDPRALQRYGISLQAVAAAVRRANRDVGAKTLEINQVEYFVRGLGYADSSADLGKAVVTTRDGVAVQVRDLARVSLGPAPRRGVLDKEGAEVVGGVAVARYGANPMAVIGNIKAAIDELAPGLPRKNLNNGVESKLTIVPFYDRSELIGETIATLEDALTLEMIITVLVVLVLVMNLRASLLIAGLLPVAVIMVFVVMRQFDIEANIVALSGIAIAIGTMVDLGIIVAENILRHLDDAGDDRPLSEVIVTATQEVRPAILTAVSTTIISFIPVFALEAAEGKLFHPLAWTKTFALAAAVLTALFVMPAVAHLIFRRRGMHAGLPGLLFDVLLLAGGTAAALWVDALTGVALAAFGAAGLIRRAAAEKAPWTLHLSTVVAVLCVLWLLGSRWLPLGPQYSDLANTLLVALVVGVILAAVYLVVRGYRRILEYCLRHPLAFFGLPAAVLVWGLTAWLGFAGVFGWAAASFDLLGVNIRTTAVWSGAVHAFPGIDKEFMPALDEGSFLLMPTTMPHAGVQQNTVYLQQLDILTAAIPEVDQVVGKLGRVESALDPAPTSMYENLIDYKSEYASDARGRPMRFRTDARGAFILRNGDTVDNAAAVEARIDITELTPDEGGSYYRQWRPHINSPDDIWQEIISAAALPGVTSAPRLQPIETRLVMLQTGMRAPMGIKVFGPDLASIEQFGVELERVLKTVPAVKAASVFAERIVGKPYINIDIDRDAAADYGLSIDDIQQVVQAAVGGQRVTSTVEGRERYAVTVRYPREMRDSPDDLARVLVTSMNGAQVPLGEVASIEYERGPQVIKSEDTFLVGYVLFDKQEGFAEVEVVEEAGRFIDQALAEGDLAMPAGVSYRFSGSYENQVRAEQRLAIIIPLVLVVIFLLLYLQFRSVPRALVIFGGAALAFSGGFIMLWCYGQDWFLNADLLDQSLRAMFNIADINLSVAVWVGFIALFGIATDDGVLMATYIDQSLKKLRPTNVQELREAVLLAGGRRIRPAAMTTATTLIALLPILTSDGRGSDIMIPMAIPAVGGMLAAAVAWIFTPLVIFQIEKRRLPEVQS